MWPATVWAFTPLKTKPLEITDNLLLRTLNQAILQIRISFLY
jgi:hypothetical protein